MAIRCNGRTKQGRACQQTTNHPSGWCGQCVAPTAGTVSADTAATLKAVADIDKYAGLTGSEKRGAIQEDMRSSAETLSAGVVSEILALQPIGKASEVSSALNLQPGQGIPADTPIGRYVFAKARFPTNAQLVGWRDRYTEAESLRRRAMDYSVWADDMPNTTIGNQSVVRNMEALDEQGLLDEPERELMARMQGYWLDHADASDGLWDEDGTIGPIFDNDPDKHVEVLRELDDEALHRTWSHAFEHPPAARPPLLTQEHLDARKARLDDEVARRAKAVLSYLD